LTIEEGLDFIEGHFEPPIYPRRISTYKTRGKQLQVNNREEAISEFKECNLLDSRISAYPYPIPECRGINRQSPNLFLADLDKKNFKTKKSFEECMHNTVDNFKVKLHGANPSVLWSGGGNHFLQPLCADIILEMESVFAEFGEPSRKLMQYLEKLVTDNKADPSHSNTVSFNNCMIRIPGSYNSKYIRFNVVCSIISKSVYTSLFRRLDTRRTEIYYLVISKIVII
jgi:hypothetical protein